MIQRDADPQAALLAAAALPWLDAMRNAEQRREALRKALRSTAWKQPMEFDAPAKRKALNLLAVFLSPSSQDRLENFLADHSMPFPLDAADESILRILTHCLAFSNEKETEPQDFFALLPALANNSQAIIADLQFLLAAESFRLCLMLLRGLKREDAENAAAFEKQAQALLAGGGLPDKNLPAMLAIGRAMAIFGNDGYLDACLDRFLRASHCPSPTLPERQFLLLSLQALSGESIDGKILKAALLAAAPDLNEKNKKFFKSGLLKAAKSRARQMAFQTLYALSFDWPRSRVALEKAMLEKNSARAFFGPLEGDPQDGYLWTLTLGVWEHLEELDAKIVHFSHKWRRERLGMLELLLLRLGLYEIEYGLTSPKIVISEILDIADLFGIPDAKSLLNGILDAAARATGKSAI